MKIVITESQYKIIKEQYETIPGRTTQLVKSLGGEGKFTIHTALQGAGAVASLATGGLGFVLPIIFGAADAALYYNEDDTKSATIVGTLSMLPFIGSVIPKIPGVKELGAKGMALLAGKLSSGAKLTKSELQIVNAINSNKSLITQELKAASTKLAPITKSVKTLRPKYISKFGQQKYDELLGEFISGKLTKDGFIKNLKSASGDTYKLANFSVKGGIKFLESELKGITDLVPYIKNKNFGSYNLKLRVNNEFKNVEVIVGDFSKKSWDALAVGDRIYVNMSRMEGATEQQIRQTLYHEATHIKDPSLVSPKLSKAYKDIENAKDAATNQFKSSYAKAMEPSGSLDDVKTAIASKERAKSLYQRYLYHPQEVIANNQMILNNMSSELDGVIQELGPAGAKKVLDNLVGYTSGKNTLSKEALDLLGKDGVEHLNGLYKFNKNYYKDFLKKVAKQSEYLKSQLNLY